MRCGVSKGKRLKRFMIVFNVLSDFFIRLKRSTFLTADGNAFVSYLGNIFENLNMSNKQLHRTNKSLVDIKALLHM